MVLTTTKGLSNAAWTAYSFGRHLRSRMSLVVTLDGSWKAADRLRMQTLFPGVTLRETSTELAFLQTTIPSLKKLADRHPMGRKIAAVTAQQTRGPLLFVDDDVLAMGDLIELKTELAAGVKRCLYLQEQAGAMNQDPAIIAAARTLNLSWIKDINVGLFLIPSQSFSLELIERILSNSSDSKSWFPDTVIFSILLAQIGHAALPTTYLVSTRGQFYFESSPTVSALQVRHYVGPVRHLMFREGIPVVLNQSLNSA